MSARERCRDCGQPLATEADHDVRGCDRCTQFDATCPHAALCWSAFAMPCPPVDWRARALAAEERDEAVAASREWAMKAGQATAERDEARRLLAAAARGELLRCGELGCKRLATRSAGPPRGASPICDECHAKDVCAGFAASEDWPDLPYASALRAAIGGPR